VLLVLEILLELEVTTNEDEDEDEDEDSAALDDELDEARLPCTELLELLATGVFLWSLPPQPAKIKTLRIPV
jgi:hypothetical protein